MSEATALHERLAGLLDQGRAVSFLQEAVGCQSVTGHEAHFVDWLEKQMAVLALDPRTSEFAPGRPNVWGMRKSEGAGPRLLFIGHSDTVHARGWTERWKGTEREDAFGAAVVAGEVWGRGTGDLKAGICASLLALDLLDRAGHRLGGDLAFAFVGDEESGEPNMGISAGVKDLARRIREGEFAKPDFAIYVEPTRLNVFPAQMGFFIAEVTITGRSAYFGVPEQGIDALKAAHSALSAIWSLSARMAGRASHPLVGRAFLLVTEIKAGGLIAVPGECQFSLIAKLLPGDRLDDAVAEFEQAVRTAAGSEVQVEIAYPAGRDHAFGGTGTEIPAAQPEVRLLGQAAASALHGRGQIEGAPYWSEMPFLTEHIGCPAVYCAPGDISNCHTLEERVNVDEFLAGIVAFAVFMASYCGISET